MARQRVQLIDGDGASLRHCAPALLKHASRRVLLVADLLQLRDAPNAVEPMLGVLALVTLERTDEHTR
eukprot:2605482-Prymnesium_polylepis.1